MHIYVSSLLKYKIHLYLYDFIGGHLYYATVEFEVQIYICIARLEIAFEQLWHQKHITICCLMKSIEYVIRAFSS
jgi:hypothetical protein